LNTDALVAEAVAAAVAGDRPDLGLAVLPVLSYALSSEHLWAPGTISLSPATLLSVLDDLGASLARTGFGKLVFLNGHGGNSALLRVACREIRVHHGLLTFLAHPSVPADQGGQPAHQGEGGLGVHGGAGETSMVLHLRPDLVDLAQAERSLPEYLQGFDHVGFGKEISFGWTSADVMPSGVIGDPTLAAAAAGKELFERCIEHLGEVFEEVRRFSFPNEPPAASPSP
jgi:creatinine amidohydrolase